MYLSCASNSIPVNFSKDSIIVLNFSISSLNLLKSEVDMSKLAPVISFDMTKKN